MILSKRNENEKKRRRRWKKKGRKGQKIIIKGYE